MIEKTDLLQSLRWLISLDWRGPWVIPQSPALNHMYRPIRRGKKMGIGKDSTAAVYGLILASAVNSAQEIPTVLSGDVALAVFFDLRRRDVDSGLKSLLDACQDVFYENDKQVKHLLICDHGLKTTDTYLFIAAL